MNDAQLGFFRYVLLVLRNDIPNNAEKTCETPARGRRGGARSCLIRSPLKRNMPPALRNRDRERKLPKKIEQSIQLIDSGEYGYCDETGEPIGIGRLLARPTANLSLEAQQRREMKQKMFGG